MQPTMSAAFKAQTSKQAPVVKADLTGKTVCVLGANTGIGFQSTKHFAAMNPTKIILACRSETRGREAVQRLRDETGYTKGELQILDLADFASTKQFADRLEQEGGRLDILIANAASEPRKFITTKDGWESTLHINHLGTSLTVLRLLPTLLRTAKDNGTLSRIVVVSSDLHYNVTIAPEVRTRPGSILQTLSSAEFLQPLRRIQEQYAVTKLLNVFFARALNAHLGPSAPIIVDAVNPGYCVSELRRNVSGFTNIMLKLLDATVALTAEEGSRRLVWAALGMPSKEDALRG
ncbi:Short chain dehydrogenase sol3 [Mycena venus]|uniref:Short chain dehydrogenase sol3 n=1 Tax=Mycena venus TaxID=2733690 RepID=A0A8H6Y547_9AGAR|nr:Short chain dehydrogenase sol3 [Mycena venus]